MFGYYVKVVQMCVCQKRKSEEWFTLMVYLVRGLYNSYTLLVLLDLHIFL